MSSPSTREGRERRLRRRRSRVMLSWFRAQTTKHGMAHAPVRHPFLIPGDDDVLDESAAVQPGERLQRRAGVVGALEKTEDDALVAAIAVPDAELSMRTRAWAKAFR